jgi:hypothetical protein
MRLSIQRILIAVGDAPVSETGVELARSLNGEVSFMHVNDADSYPGDSGIFPS